MYLNSTPLSFRRCLYASESAKFDCHSIADVEFEAEKIECVYFGVRSLAKLWSEGMVTVLRRCERYRQYLPRDAVV